MIKWFFKYGYVVFLLNTILYSILDLPFFIPQTLFLSIMFLGLLFLLINPIQIKEVLFHKSFAFLVSLNLINFLYFFIFDDINSQSSFEYLMARFMQFSLISLSIYHNFEYFKKKFFDHVLFFIYIVIFLSLILYPDIFAERYQGIIWNPNMMGSITTIGFAILLLKEEKKTNFQFFLMGILFIVTLSTGSRSVLIGIVLSFVFKFGLSYKNLIYAILALISFIIVASTNLDTSINRITSQSLFNDRTEQFQKAIENIMEKPWSGYGLSKYSGENPEPEKISNDFETQIMFAHNGYLALFIQLGFIFGFLTLFIIFKKSYTSLLFFRNSSNYIRIYSFIILFTLITAVFESFITGINEFQTNLFWFSLAILSFTKYQFDNEI
ncbi:MAG: O-antigen ligase family protein [Flavobacteriales bacterium]